MHNPPWPYEPFEADLDFWREEIERRLAARENPPSYLAREADALAERIQRRITFLKQATPWCRSFAEAELNDLLSRMAILAAEAQGDDRPAAYAV